MRTLFACEIQILQKRDINAKSAGFVVLSFLSIVILRERSEESLLLLFGYFANAHYDKTNQCAKFRGLFFALCFVAMICLCKDRRCGLSLLVAYLTNARAVLLALNGRFFTPFFTLCFKIYANFAFLIKFLRIFSLNLVLSLSAE